MLERNDKFYTIYESDVSIKNVYNSFFEIEDQIIYVVDTTERFVGIITSWKFSQAVKAMNVPINRQCLTIALKAEKAVLEEAKQLFERHHITTAIPVLDQEGKICYEVRKKRENHKDGFLADFYAKLRRYEKSYYLGCEIAGLRKILQEQPVTIVGTKKQFQCICGELFQDSRNISFIEKLEDPYEFMCSNVGLLVDVSITAYSMRKDLYLFCNNGYGWHTFLNMAMQMVEMECFSRFYRVTNNPIATLKDYLDKYSDGRVYISSWGILTSAMKAYLNNTSLKLIEQRGLQREKSAQYYYVGNGVEIKELTGGELLVMEQADVMLQYFYLNREFQGQVPILNFVFDVKVEIPGKEKETIIRDRLFFLRDYVANLENEGKQTTLYEGKTRNLRHLMELERSLKFCMTRRFENDLIDLQDHTSNLVNIENGIRKTSYQPEQYVGTIYIFGMCTIYGAMVEDGYTIPSIIQKYINESGKAYRVVNLGSELPINPIRIKEVLNISENDLIVCLFPYMTEEIKVRIPVTEIGEKFNRIWKEEFYDKECFMDAIQHCGDNGNIIYSKIIYQELEKHLVAANEKSLRQNSVYNIFKPNTTDLDLLYSFDSYIAELCKEKKGIPEHMKKIGCIVMNCNPFTLGHRYLIEYALNIVDYLYIFVVEENRSFFPFQHRYEMVKRGTCDLENVSVVRSGKLIISSETFPNYFTKDRWHSQEDICLNEDLRIFAQYIAPVLDIQYRFVGEEPTDYVTNQYNIAMKRILPDIAGIQIVEIPRLEASGTVISATTVRECYKKKDFSRMSALVPKTTLDYLQEIQSIM